MVTPVIRYNLDPSGISPDNLVVDEIHNLSSRPIRGIAPTYGTFFTTGLVVKDNVTQAILTRGVDYQCVELSQTATADYGKELCNVILIINKDVSGQVKITYQVLGGFFSHSAAAIQNLYDILMNDDRPIYWPDVLNKPAEFPPNSHLHDIRDVYGFQYLVDALERIRQAILITNTPAFEHLIDWINRRLAELLQQVAEMIRLGIKDIPFATETVRGILKLAKQTEVNGTEFKLNAQNEVIVPNVLVDDKAVTPKTLSARVATADRTGLIKLASAAEVEEGTNSDKAITPITLLSRTTSKTRTGLIQLATIEEAIEGTNDNKAITPATLAGAVPTATDIKKGISALNQGNTFNETIDDFNNPADALTSAGLAAMLSIFKNNALRQAFFKSMKARSISSYGTADNPAPANGDPPWYWKTNNELMVWSSVTNTYVSVNKPDATNLSGNGYVIFANGLILQWGPAQATLHSYDMGDTVTVTWPVTFPNVPLFFSTTPYDDNSDPDEYPTGGSIVNTASLNVNNVTFWIASGGFTSTTTWVQRVKWFAVGY
jgi:hypothetical protein